MLSYSVLLARRGRSESGIARKTPETGLQTLARGANAASLLSPAPRFLGDKRPVRALTGSQHCHSAIHMQRCASDIACIAAGKIGHRGPDIGPLAHDRESTRLKPS